MPELRLLGMRAPISSAKLLHKMNKLLRLLPPHGFGTGWPLVPLFLRAVVLHEFLWEIAPLLHGTLQSGSSLTSDKISSVVPGKTVQLFASDNMNILHQRENTIDLDRSHCFLMFRIKLSIDTQLWYLIKKDESHFGISMLLVDDAVHEQELFQRQMLYTTQLTQSLSIKPEPSKQPCYLPNIQYLLTRHIQTELFWYKWSKTGLFGQLIYEKVIVIKANYITRYFIKNT
jgi:hypothetical protein